MTSPAAALTIRRLGWHTGWDPSAFTVALAQPTVALARPWVLGGDRHTGRIIPMPGMQRAWLDEFFDDLTAAHRGRAIIPAPRRRAPRPGPTS